MAHRLLVLLIPIVLVLVVVAVLWFGRPADQPPEVSWVTPAVGTESEEGALLTLQVEAADPDGLLARVEFFRGDTLLGTVREPPYVWSWGEAPVGEWVLHARAVDEDGLTGDAPPRTIRVIPVPNRPPVVELTAPTDGSTVRAGRPVPIRTWASDADGEVLRVEFLVDGEVVAVKENMPYDISVGTLQEGTHEIAVRAVDDEGATTTSETAHVTAVVEEVMQVSLEAEEGKVVFPMSVAKDEDASGGRFVTTLVREHGQVVFSFDLKVPATVVVWCRVLAPDGMHDSFYVHANDGEKDVFDILEKKWTGSWEWVPLCGRGGTGEPETEVPRLLRLPAGANTITFRGRERNTFLDRIILTDDLQWRPEGANWDAYGNPIGAETVPVVF